MATFGTTGHTLTNGGNGAWAGVGHYWIYDRTVNNDVFYKLYNHSSDYDIKYDGSNWYDAGSNVPGWFGTSATDSTAIDPPGSATTLYFWANASNPNNPPVFIADIINNDPQSTTTSGGVGFTGSFYDVTPTHFSWEVTHTSGFTSPQTYELHSTTMTPTFISDLVVGAANGSSNSRTHTWGTPDVIQSRDAYGTIAAELTLAHATNSQKKVHCNFW